MSWTPTDAQVRNLAIFLWRRWNPNGPTWAQTNQSSRDEALEEARAVLVAVGPMIAASALRDAADPRSATWPRGMYGSPDDMFARRDLLNRADQIEEEAGR